MPVPIPTRGEPSKNPEEEDIEDPPIFTTTPPSHTPNTTPVVGYNRFSASNRPDTYTVPSGYMSDLLSQGRMNTGIQVPIFIFYISCVYYNSS